MESTCLIVGASRGIGFELARQYAADGWSVHATTRSPADPGDLGIIDGNVTLHELDVRSTDQASAMVNELEGVALDVLIHNAGVYRNTPRDVIMEVNAKAPIRVVEALLGNVVAAHGRIGLMTSQLGARRGTTGSLGDYGDSKAALNDEFRRRESGWRSQGVLAVVIHPGWVKTDMGGSSASVTVADSAAGIRRLMASLTAEMHGRFWTWESVEHDW